jgi:hypothetical protein
MLENHRIARNLGQGLLLLCLLVFIQGCHPETIKVDLSGAVMLPPSGDCEGGASGCDPIAYSGSAQGFVSTNGPTPVGPGYTCSAISTKCQAADGTVQCSARPQKYCKSKFQYPVSGTVGYCSCSCLP